MSGEVKNLIANVEGISDEVREKFGRLLAEQLNWKTDENVWSIGQYFDHLITTNEKFSKSCGRNTQK